MEWGWRIPAGGTAREMDGVMSHDGGRWGTPCLSAALDMRQDIGDGAGEARKTSH